MTHQVNKKVREVSKIISAARGELTGRTRLQKTAFLLDAAGLSADFEFRYKHYGPYSEELAQTTSIAPFLSDFKEEKHRSSWGGTYSVFRTGEIFDGNDDDAYRRIVLIAKQADPIVLELAATAAYLAKESNPDPWGETARRKPEKISSGRLERAKKLYEDFKAVEVPNPLPDI